MLCIAGACCYNSLQLAVVLKEDFKPVKNLLNRAVFTATAMACLLVLLGHSAQASSTNGASVPEAIELTFYNQGASLVKEVRSLPLNAGVQTIRWSGIPSELLPNSVLLFPLVGAGQKASTLQVLEQQVVSGNLSSDLLLKQAIGQVVMVQDITQQKDSHNPASGYVTGVLKAISGEFALIEPVATAGKATSGLQVYRLSDVVVRQLPKTVGLQNELQFKLASPQATTTKVQLAYLTNGLGFENHYLALLNADNTLDLQAWVTLNNSTSQTYSQATVKLLAGDIKRQESYSPYPKVYMQRTAMAADAGALTAPQATSEGLGDFYLYTLPNAVSLAPYETKQVGLFSAKHLPVTITYVFNPNAGYQWYGYNGGDQSLSVKQPKTPVTIMLEVKNEKALLGQPLPAGLVRAYQSDKSQQLQLVGEDTLSNTPVGELAKLELGKAFDVLATKTQVGCKQTAQYQEAKYEVMLTNRKALPATVLVMEHPQGDWELTASNLPAEAKKQSPLRFKVTVPAEGEAKLTYTLRQWIKR
jgi:hypothetical protein